MDRKARIRTLTDFVATWTAILLPGFAALTRIPSESVWRDDLPAIRGLGLVALGGPATLTTVAMQAVSLIPLGPLHFRIAALSAVMLSVCAALIFTLGRRLLEAHVPGSSLNIPLAAVTALTATLGPGLQGEGTVGGGATIPLAASLFVLLAYLHADRPRAQRHTLTAIALGALVSESLVASAAVTAVIVVAMLVRRDWPRSRRGWVPLGVLLAVGAVALMPALLRPASPHAALNYGRSLSMVGLVSIDTAAVRMAALEAWRHEVGTVSMVIAALGAVVGLLRARTRWLAAPLAVLIVADLLIPATTGAVLTMDLLTPLRVLAIASVAIAAGLGVQVVVTTLIDSGLPMARAAAVLLVLFNLTLVAVTAEQAAFSVDRTDQFGANAYVDEAMGRLDPNAMVLARSHALVWRLVAASTINGVRPDVVLVPFPLISRGTVASGVLAAEPGATLLLRDMVIDGRPGEHAMSRIADRRMVYVELDPGWDARIADHLEASGMWLALKPHPLGRSDRRMAAEDTVKVQDRVIKVARASEPSDRATEAVVRSMGRQQTVAAALARDRQTTHELVEMLAAASPEDPFVRAMRQRLDHARGTDIDVSGLVR